MTKINILSLDPSLNNLGIALMSYDVESASLSIISMKLFTTDNEAGKKVRKSSDDLRRAKELRETLTDWQKKASIVCAEVPTGCQSARGALANGIVIGVLASITLPLIEVSPSEAKKAALGKKTGSKEEMIAWSVEQYPNASWLKRKFKGQIVHTAANEHLADAVAIAHAAVDTLEFKSAMAMTRMQGTYTG